MIRSTVTISHGAAPGDRFAAGCLDGSVGKRVPLRLGAVTVGFATIKSYEVTGHGAVVLITMDVELAHTVADPPSPRVPKTIHLDSGI